MHGKGMIGLAILAWASGCSAEHSTPFERQAVRGTVTLDGQPLSNASIRFLPEANTNGPKVILEVREGEFDAGRDQGPVAGLHRVEIVLNEDVALAHDDEEVWANMKAEPFKRRQRLALPLQYNERSTLTATIEPRTTDEVQSLVYTLKSR